MECDKAVGEKKDKKVTDLFLVRYPDEPIHVPDKGEVSIGRSDKNDIVLTEPRVSRKHAVIEWLEPQNVYVISDLGSSNGTYLNGYKLPVHHPGFLNDWDKIRVASTVFTVRVVDDPSEITNEFAELRNRVLCEATEVVTLAELKAAQEQAGLAGKLDHLCPVELFQMLETGGKTGILEIKTTRGKGIYKIYRGQVIAAQFGEFRAEKAVYEILNFSKGMFSFSPEDITAKNPQIKRSTTGLLMEGCRLLDEASANGNNLIDPRIMEEL